MKGDHKRGRQHQVGRELIWVTVEGDSVEETLKIENRSYILVDLPKKWQVRAVHLDQLVRQAETWLGRTVSDDGGGEGKKGQNDSHEKIRGKLLLRKKNIKPGGRLPGNQGQRLVQWRP